MNTGEVPGDVVRLDDLPRLFARIWVPTWIPNDRKTMERDEPHIVFIVATDGTSRLLASWLMITTDDIGWAV